VVQQGRRRPPPQSGLQSFYNTSKFDFDKLRSAPDNIAQDLLRYIRSFSPNVRAIFNSFGFGGSLAAPSEVGTGRNEDAPVPLSQVVQLLNDRFGTNFTATDELFWEQVRDDALANPNLQQAGAANTRDDFAYALYQHLEELVVNRMDRNGGQAGMFFDNPEVRSVIQNWMLDQVYDRIRPKA
jgi:type I restriction enzyme R subunit